MCSLKLFRTPVYSFLRACMLSHSSHVQLFANLWTVVCQAPPSMGFSRQEYWNWFCQALLQEIIATQGSQPSMQDIYTSCVSCLRSPYSFLPLLICDHLETAGHPWRKSIMDHVPTGNAQSISRF